MGLLSLQDPPQEPAPKLTRAEAIFVSIGVHILLFVLLLVLPGRLPEPLSTWPYTVSPALMKSSP